MNRDQIKRQRAKRLKKVLMKAMGRFVFLPCMLCCGLWMVGIVVVTRALCPDLDPNGWPFFLRVFPIWITLLWLTLYALAALEVRLMIHRKGTLRTILYLFPRAFSKTESWLDRFSYWALGIHRIIRQARLDRGTSCESDNHAVQ